ncbi:hypothetical protein F0L74_28960 [Chitinophaga agrisoli]|uniref:Lipoprotein n=1 Tax=Chitinophaga agrisoli TaxID=2607653 RepID=A0A5B2VNB6_9BACT|nr:hypothetical protein [Chitinophaga agrisoli]KAA2240198.1 hypothetical protein F0L74_28960 [Chitinophaga agrisoli]
MNRLLALLLVFGILSGCGSGKKRSPGDRPVTFEDFKAIFPASQTPYRLYADSLLLKQPDSVSVKPDVLKQFLSDTIAGPDTLKNNRLKYFPLAYIAGSNLQYFVIKAVDKGAATAYICFTDKKGRYLGRMTAAKKVPGSPEDMSFTLDSRYTIKVSTEKELSATATALREDFYSVGEDGGVTLVMTNSNGPTSAGQIFNPIDTLPRKHKYSGDYTSGEMNIVSIRDGQDPKSFQFFITFSKDNGGCKGEINGIGHYTGSNKGEYKDKETSCGIAFQFSSGRVSIREVGGCGAYRGIKCFFEGGFAKKKKEE